MNELKEKWKEIRRITKAILAKCPRNDGKLYVIDFQTKQLQEVIEKDDERCNTKSLWK